MAECDIEIRLKVSEKIGEVEKAVESLQDLRKTLVQKAYEVNFTLGCILNIVSSIHHSLCLI